MIQMTEMFYINMDQLIISRMDHQNEMAFYPLPCLQPVSSVLSDYSRKKISTVVPQSTCQLASWTFASYHGSGVVLQVDKSSYITG